MGKELQLISVNFRFWTQSIGILLQGEGKDEGRIYLFLDLTREDFVYMYQENLQNEK